jgi:hypothetical protein
VREKCSIFGADQIRPTQEVNLPAQVADTNAKRYCSMPLSHASSVLFLLLLMTLPAYTFATDEQPANVLHYRTPGFDDLTAKTRRSFLTSARNSP